MKVQTAPVGRTLRLRTAARDDRKTAIEPLKLSATTLFALGLDTVEIGSRLNVREAVVYNLIARHKAQVIPEGLEA